MTPMVSIGSFAFPEPSKYSSTTSTVVDSARNVKGYVIGAVIGTGYRKSKCPEFYHRPGLGLHNGKIQSGTRRCIL